jgi:hypothetical protein
MGDPVLLRMTGRGWILGRALEYRPGSDAYRIDTGSWKPRLAKTVRRVSMWMPPEQLWCMNTAKLGEAMDHWNPQDWRGACHAVACKLISYGLMPPGSKARYGFYYGKVEPNNGIFNHHKPMQRHGWIELDNQQALDPTRWVFEAEDGWLNKRPCIWLSDQPNPSDYDVGMRRLRAMMRRPPPAFTPEKAFKGVFYEAIGEGAYAFLCQLAESKGGVLDTDQLFWLANADPDDLTPWAEVFYRGLDRINRKLWVPKDYWTLVMDDEED